MKQSLPVFVDSDVVVSSLLSRSGAAFFCINNPALKPIISDVSYKELSMVVERLGINQHALNDLVKRKFNVIRLNTTLKRVKEQYGRYVTDQNDAHIVAGAVKTKAGFLISYNLKHFKIDRIKSDFDLLLLTPARFLQYLRSS